MEMNDVISVSDAGQLTASGLLANSAEDLQRLFVERIPSLTADWNQLQIVFFMHGGLVNERAALAQADEFWRRCFPAEIYPISIIWHTDYWSTVVRSMFSISAMRRLADHTAELSMTRKNAVYDPAALDGKSPLERAGNGSIFNWTDSLIEFVARFGTGKLTWDDIKQDAFLASESSEGATHPVVAALRSLLDVRAAKIHVVAHSAGAVFAAPFLRVLTDLCDIASCTLWAPACTCSIFERFYVPLLTANKVRELNLFTLAEQAELSDNILHVYHKSTLYLISNAYESRLALSRGSAPGEPLLGMTRFIGECLQREAVNRELLAAHKIRWSIAPNGSPLGSMDASRARGHLDFPRDDATLRSTMACILGAA
jgi:hypothetical protein